MKPLNQQQISILDASVKSVLHHFQFESLHNKRIFLTGGTGFFGVWLLTILRALQQLGVYCDVCILSRNPKLFLIRYPQFRNQSEISFFTGDIRDFTFPRAHFDYLIHAATDTSMSAHSNPLKMFDDIVIGTRQIMHFAQKCNVKRMLLISSGAVYGAQPGEMTHQPDDSVTACSTLIPTSAYGEGKRVMELLGTMIHSCTGIESVIARCYTFCGPCLPMDQHFAIGNFIRDALFGEEIKVKGDGTAIRSYLFGADLAVWLFTLIIKGDSGSSYNVGSDTPISIRDLATLVRDLLAPDKPIRVLGNSNIATIGGNSYVPSISRARGLGCQPWTSLENAIKLSGKYWHS